VTGPASVQTITDGRVGLRTCGPGAGFVSKSGDTVTGPLSVASASTGVAALAVDPNAQVVGFFGATPATQAPALSLLSDTTTGVASSTVVDVGPAFSQSQVDNNFAALTAKVNALIAALKRHGLMAS
jgi:hypothetical protein